MTGCLRALALGLLLALAACGEEVDTAAKPAPQELTREAIGYYCNMIVADHTGPKGQVFLKSQAAPVWFSSVRDALAFTLLPEEPKHIAAIYVNDMGAASWAAPEPGTWIEAKAATYVIGSGMRGGMGAQEAVPFAERAQAEAFAARHGGRIVGYAEIPHDYILSPDEPAHAGAQEAGHHGHGHDSGMGHGADN